MSLSLSASLTWLRSELAVIIMLEHLARHGGDHAVIVMGDMHTPQIEKVGTNYGADMETFSPPEEYFHHGHNHDGR